jgi:hypothetical protein
MKTLTLMSAREELGRRAEGVLSAYEVLDGPLNIIPIFGQGSYSMCGWQKLGLPVLYVEKVPPSVLINLALVQPFA